MSAGYVVLRRCNATWTPTEFGGPGMLYPMQPCRSNNGPHVCYRHVGDVHICDCGSVIREPSRDLPPMMG